MEVPLYMTTSDVQRPYGVNKESFKFIQTFISQKQTPKNIQYLHTYLYVYYFQLPCKVTLNFNCSSKCQQTKAAQHAVHSRQGCSTCYADMFKFKFINFTNLICKTFKYTDNKSHFLNGNKYFQRSNFPALFYG
jgi:hypothetical protein